MQAYYDMVSEGALVFRVRSKIIRVKCHVVMGLTVMLLRLTKHDSIISEISISKSFYNFDFENVFIIFMISISKTFL